MNITLLIGNTNKPLSETHSVANFSDRNEALAFFWAMRRNLFPQRVWINSGVDGWISNDATVSAEIPENLRARVAEIVREDNEVAMDGIGSDEVSRAA